MTMFATVFYANGVNIYQIKAIHSEIKAYLLFLGNISKDFTCDKVKTELN